MLPIPNNLKGILQPINNENTEFEFYGELICRCLHKTFEILYVGDDKHYSEENIIKVAQIEGEIYLIIKSKCNKCNTIYNLFDADYNGWNGYVCEGFGKRLNPRPKTIKWYCNKCSNSEHKIKVKIFSEGRIDFINETQGEFHEDDWVEGFSSIKFEIECLTCSIINKKWILYEAM